jgi:hypothetical protein
MSAFATTMAIQKVDIRVLLRRLKDEWHPEKRERLVLHIGGYLAHHASPKELATAGGLGRACKQLYHTEMVF